MSAAPVDTGSVTSIWLDCDPGHDDACAILLAGYSPRINLIGISTVAGNQSIEKTTANALNVLAISGLAHIPVYVGRDQPILRPAVRCPEIHGASGLEGPHFPKNTVHAQKEKAYEAMANAVKQAKTPLTIVAVGPLTNVALMLLTHPEFAANQSIKEIVLMGGAVGVGNTGPAAEFNIQVDPEAASIVFNSGIPIVMVPLEVTHRSLVTPAIIQRIDDIGTPFAACIVDLMLFFRKAYREVFGFSSPPLHDPCAVAYLIQPQVYTSQLMRVDIDCESKLCYGRTVCDIYGRDPRPKNVRVCLKMEVEPFWDVMIDALKLASARSALNEIKEGQEAYQARIDREAHKKEVNAALSNSNGEVAGPLAASTQQNFPSFPQ